MPMNFTSWRRSAVLLAWAVSSIFLSGCLSRQPGFPERRKGDEIVAAGQFFHTGTRVVLWMDPGGYDGYRVERRFVPFGQASFEESQPHLDSPGTPNRYDIRTNGLPADQLDRIRGGGWDLPTLQSNVDQFVLHFDVAGTSRTCVNVLQDRRDLSIHFMCDLDGTIYQTIDLKERARHATIANGRSIGIEIANMGSYREAEKDPLGEWYQKGWDGRVEITIPKRFGKSPERVAHFVGRPARRAMVVGEVQGSELHQYDFTPQQYKALARLTAALCVVFPRIECDYPRDSDGRLLNHKMSAEEYKDFHGVLGHYHIQANKVDPGPALQWDYVIGEARRLMKEKPQRDVKGRAQLNRPKLIIDN